MNHPSDLKLERHLVDPERSAIAPHLGGCERCRERLSQMRQQGEDFRRFVYPATLDAVTRPRFRSLRALWLLAPAAGLATVLLIARQGPTSDYVGSKGGQLDGKPGTEKFFAICGGDPAALEQAARKIGAAALDLRALPDVRGPQASLRIEKRP